jgi:hypothetical protein
MCSLTPLGCRRSDAAARLARRAEPDRVSAESVEFELAHARLSARGVVLLPSFVVEYTYSGGGYRAFVSGLDGHVGGLTHLLASDAVLRGGGAGALAGVLAAAFSKAAPLALGAPIGGALVGAAVGYLMAMQRTYSWEDDGRRRTRDAEHNRRWEAQAFWQAEVRRVMAAAAAREEHGGARFDRGTRRERPQQPRDESPPRRRASARDWRTFGDLELLGVPERPPATAAVLGAAYRREAMKWHPDHNQHLPPAELAECQERFAMLTEAYGRLRRAKK